MKFDVSGDLSASKKGLMLHGMALNGGEMMSLTGNVFGKDYCLIFPTYDGHHEEDKTRYTTIGNQADKIIAWLESHHIDRLDFVMGASLGAMTALEILQRKKIKVRRYVLDGLPFADFNAVKLKIMKTILVYVMKQCKKHPEKRNYIDRTFGTSAPAIKKFAGFAEKEDIDNLVSQAFSGKVPGHLDMSGEDIVFVYGSEEDAYPHFKKFTAKYPDGYRVIVKKGYRHCQYFRENIKEYADSLLMNNQLF